jgi:geranylgeranyl diphosphate synthase type I
MPVKTKASTGSRRPKGTARRQGAKALRGNPFVAILETVRHEADTRLAGFLDAKVDAAREHGPEVVDMARAVRDLSVRGGKRLRAALVVVGYRAASASADLEPALDAGVAIELLHTYFLIHDDWMDDDDVRRGGPTVHALLEKRYGSKRLGHACAVLAGDYAVALATEALARVEVPAERVPRAFGAFAQMQADAVAGQQLDVVARSSDAEKTYTLKTGSYTVAGPLRIGAILAGGSPKLIAGLERFALPAGVAFQIRDDLLSAFGDPAETGKPFANDVKNGKRTLLVEQALRLARGKDLKTLKYAFGNASATIPELRRAVEVLDRSGARQAAEERTAVLAAQALRAVDEIGLPETRKRLLVGAIDALLERRS